MITKFLQDKIANTTRDLQPTIFTAILNIYKLGINSIKASDVKKECYILDNSVPWNSRIAAICNAMKNVKECGGIISGKTGTNDYTLILGDDVRNEIYENPKFEIKSHFTKKAIKNSSNKVNELMLSKNFKVVMICAGNKVQNSSLIYNNQVVRFHALSNRNNNEFLPDDLIVANGNITWRDYIVNNQIYIPKMAYELYQRNEYRNLYNRYRDGFYILSAGWGLVKAEFRLPNYDITFSNSQKIPKNTKRKFNQKIPVFNDFNQLLGLNDEEDIIFIGGKDYLPLFINLTQNLPNRKIIYYNSIIQPFVPNNTFVCKRFITNTRTNWHYELASDLSNNIIP